MHPAGDRLRKSPVIVCEKQKKHYPNEGSYAIIILNRYPQVPGRKKEGQRWAKTHPVSVVKRVAVTMLGGFRIRVDGNVLTDEINRSQKLWNVLCYLIAHRERTVPQSEFIELFWPEENSANPTNGAQDPALSGAQPAGAAVWGGAGAHPFPSGGLRLESGHRL